jgi:molybdenum cofactor cytidylyltransferase
MSVDRAPLRTAGIVLAAGQSRRMGKNKLLLPFEGEALVRRACRRALAAGLDPLIVVLGHESERVQRELAGVECRCVVVSDPGGDMSRSLHCGLLSLPPDAAAVIVMLADMVHVSEHMVQALRDAARGSAASLICSRYGETVAPPVFFRRALFTELLASTGEGCGKSVIERHREDALCIDWPVAALTDVDTPEEFARL